MKKTICILLLVCFLCTGTFASPLIDNNNETRTVRISGTSAAKNSSVSVTIIKKADGILPSQMSESIFFYTLDTDENGSYNGQFILPSAAARGVYYSVYVSDDSTPGEFYYATESEISSCISAFAGADAETIEGVIENYTAPKNILGVSLDGDYSKYPVWSQKVMVELLGERAPERITDIIECFNAANEAAFLMGGGSADVKNALSSNLLGNTISADASLDALSEMFASVRGTANPEMTGDITENIAHNLRVATAIVKINSATKGKMTEVLREYNDVLLLSLDEGYAAVDEIEINKALTDKSFTTLLQVQQAFENAVLQGLTPVPTPPSYGGGGSGGGGGTKKEENIIEFAPSPIPETIKAPFNDIDNVSWAKEAIAELCSKEIISGYEDGTFKPYNTVTRAEYTKLIVSLVDDLNTNASTGFSDVSSTDWFAPYIEKAVANGIVNGVGDKFLPDNSITREDAAVIIYRFLKDKIDFTNKISFADEGDISEYAKEAVSYLAGAGIINGIGDGIYMPKNTLTRAQAAVLIHSAMDKLQ